MLIPSLRLQTFLLAIASLGLAMGAHAQAGPPRTRADSLKADSVRVADSIAVVRELEGRARPAGAGQQGGPANPRLLPDLSVVGDLIGDLSPRGSTQEGGARLGVREVEVAISAAVDPYFRGDVFLGFSDAEGAAIEQAWLTTTALPWGIEARLGRMLLPVGKENTTHRHDLHTFEYPYVLQRFLGEEGLKGTGIYASRIFAPFGFYQEVIVTAVDRFGEAPTDLQPEEPANKTVRGMGYSGRLRNYWDLSQASNLELSASAITGMREQPVTGASGGVTAANARQSVFGVDATFRWRPLQQGLYKSLLVRAEAMRQENDRDPRLPAGSAVQYDGPARAFSGWYAFGRWQMGRRWYLGARVDALEDPEWNGRTTRAASGYWEFFPSEFSKLLAGWERVKPPAGADGTTRLIVQAAFALGPHRPHPF